MEPFGCSVLFLVSETRLLQSGSAKYRSRRYTYAVTFFHMKRIWRAIFFPHRAPRLVSWKKQRWHDSLHFFQAVMGFLYLKSVRPTYTRIPPLLIHHDGTIQIAQLECAQGMEPNVSTESMGLYEGVGTPRAKFHLWQISDGSAMPYWV